MRYTYQQRQDRRENQGDVSEEGAGETWGGGLVTCPAVTCPAVHSGMVVFPQLSAKEPSWASLAILLCDTRGSLTPHRPLEGVGI